MRQFICGLSLFFMAQVQGMEKIYYKLSNETIDVVIPSTQKDIHTLDACIAGIKQYGKNIGRIIVVSSERFTNNAEWFDEGKFPFTKEDIALQIFKNKEDAARYMQLRDNRLSWKYQQLVKLYAAYFISSLSSNILILDSDTIFLKDVEFQDQQSNGIFQVRTEHHVPYFEHLNRLIPGSHRVFEEHSGVAHHMLFQKPVLDDLFSHIRQHHQTEPWKAICDCIDVNELLGSCFSEYEIYFNFVYSRTDQMKTRKLNMLDTGEYKDLQQFKDGGYDYISCHTWMRPVERQDVWEQTDYVWNFGFIQSCNKGMELTPIRHFASDPPLFDPKRYEATQSGDTVWVQCRFLRAFIEAALPHMAHPFVLVMSDGDESFPSDSGLDSIEMEKFLNHKNLLHVFAQNCDYRGSSTKVSHLPIGMDFHTVAYKGAQGGWGQKGSPKEQEKMLKEVLATLLPTSQRKMKAFVDFHHSDTMRAGFKRYLQHGEDRASIFERLRSTGLIDYEGFMPRVELWKRKGEYAFSVSPHGNGWDCHRTWEDLVLGCIVIVKTSPLDPLYEGLPVVIVKDWSEVTSENLEKWLTIYHNASENPAYREKLTTTYWLSKIEEKAAEAQE